MNKNCQVILGKYNHKELRALTHANKHLIPLLLWRYLIALSAHIRTYFLYTIVYQGDKNFVITRVFASNL